MRRGRRKYDSEDYFNFLYDLGFDSDDYISLAKYLHGIEYKWNLRMDENRKFDGMEMRKYYLADDLGYLPEDIDIYDEYIFGEFVSILEMLVGFSNRICRDLTSEYRVFEIVMGILDRCGILVENWVFEERIDFVENVVKKWKSGIERCKLFGIEDWEGMDLWTQANIWLDEQ